MAGDAAVYEEAADVLVCAASVCAEVAVLLVARVCESGEVCVECAGEVGA